MRSRALAFVATGLLLAACGPSATAAATADKGPPPAATPASASADPAPTPAPTPTAADAPAPPPGEIRDESDPCAPAGAAYEKSVRPALKECYRAGKKTNPNLVGKARLVIDVDGKGKVASIKSPDKSELGDKVLACMLQALKSTPFGDADKCKGRTVTIPIEFPTR